MRPTQILSVGRYRHLKITTKDVAKGFYKGNRTGSMGRHTKYGGYVIEWNKVRTYTVPENLKDFKVTISDRRQRGKRGCSSHGCILTSLS
jgi:large subunit ribosomal protein L41